MKLFNRVTVAGWVLIAAGSLVAVGCGGDDEDDATAITGGMGLELEGSEAAEEGGETAEEGGETTEESGETAGETAEEEGGEAAEAEGGETGEEEGGEAAEEEGGEAAEEEGGEAAEEEGGEATEEEGGEGGEVSVELPQACGEDGETVYCPEVTPSETAVEVLQVTEGFAPDFTGGDVPTGDYEITSIALYTGAMTADGSAIPIPLAINDNGSTGAATFDGDAWGIQANLNVGIEAVGNALDLNEALAGGGCFAAEGNVLAGDVTQCAEEEVEESSFELPNTFQYTNNGGSVDLLLVFPVEALTESIPPELAPVVGALLVNDLPVVLTMEAK